MIGRTLSHYKVLDEVSRGGMGIVYRALDLKLNREVALKVLPPELVSDPERKHRFIQEAQAAAALQHPHIAVIHEIDEAEGVTFIAMELIRGKKLSEMLSGSRLPVPRALELGVQVADGLARAHEKGVIHRDLKPANVMVGEDGHAKIIDFGLAKLVAPLSGGENDVSTAFKETDPGRVMGTLSYMSPEQARGQKVDHRTDLFTCGIVLYEMLTGELPFQGATGTETLNAIIRSPAPPLSGGVQSPVAADLERVVHRCLEKDPEDRYQTAKDLLSELRRVKKDSDSGITRRGGIVQPVVARKWRTATILAGVVLLAAMVAYISFFRLGALTGRRLPRLANPRQVTSAVGREDRVTWSPDGGRLAYTSNESGNWDIWMAQIGEGRAVNMTSDYEGEDSLPSWSPDGGQIAFRSDREGGGYFVMSALGGKPRRIVSDASGFSPPQWSAEGTRLACIGYAGGVAFAQIVTLSTLESRKLPVLTRDGSIMELSWSPDERFFAYVDGTSLNADVTRLWVSRLSDGQAIPITNGMSNDWSPSWSPDGRTLFFVSNRGGAMDLWAQPISAEGQPEGPPQPLTTGLGMRSVALSRDGKRLAYSRGRKVANLWRVPILEERLATWSDAQQLTMDEAFIEYVDVSPDRTRIAVSSDRRGNQDLWVFPVDGGPMEQLTTDKAPEWRPSWSPDGKEIAYYGYRSGNREIYVMPADGGPARQITQKESQDLNPSWSPDGRWIAFNSPEDIWIVAAEGGEPLRLTEDPAYDLLPRWAPDGHWIVFSSTRGDGVFRLWRMPPSGGEPIAVTKGPGLGQVQWSRNGKAIYFLAARRDSFWAVYPEEKIERPVTDFRGKRGQLGVSGLATDGTYLYFTWEEDTGDIWVMDVLEDR